MKSIYIANLPYNATEDEIRSFFAENVQKRRHGTVGKIRVVTERETGRSRGFGFVEVESDSDVEASIADLNGRDFGGRRIVIAKANEERRDRRDLTIRRSNGNGERKRSDGNNDDRGNRRSYNDDY